MIATVRRGRGRPRKHPLPPKFKIGRSPVPQEIPQFTEQELTASLCRASFFDFVKEFWSTVVPEKPKWNWHIEYLCNELQEMAERVFLGLPKKYDLIINISPGSTKSTIASIMFQAWIWTRMASARVISASYAYSLAMDLSRKSRDVIKSDRYREIYPEIEIREDQDSKGFFVNSKGGERYAFGVGGAVLGKHAHFIIVDDPLDPNQAVSDTELKAANRWMEETLPSRKVDKRVTPTILIMQRLHEYDPTGARLDKANKVPVKHICLPAEMTEHVNPPELCHYYVDGLMDPDRLGVEVLLEAEAQGEYVYAAQYLQTPIPRGGAMFHTSEIKMMERPPDRFKKIVRYWDKAGTAGGGHFTVGVKMAWDFEGKFWILDVIRFQLDASRRERRIMDAAKMDGYNTHIGIEQEPGSGGKESAEATVRRLAGYMVQVWKVGKSDGDKEMRADPFAVQVNAGNVHMIKAPWNTDYINEMRFFPKSRYKDQVDASSGAFAILARPRIICGGGRVLRHSSRSVTEREKSRK